MMTLNSIDDSQFSIADYRFEKLDLLSNRQSGICNRQSSINTYGTGQYFFHTPSLPRTQRTCFDNSHAIPDLADSCLIMCQKLRGLPLDFLVEGMRNQSIDGNRNRLLHSRTGHFSNLAFTNSSVCFSSHIFPVSDSRLTIENQVPLFQSLIVNR
jgi:hypothetical protein